MMSCETRRLIFSGRDKPDFQGKGISLQNTVFQIHAMFLILQLNGAQLMGAQIEWVLA